MNKYVTLTLLGIMLTGNYTVVHNNNNTITLTPDGDDDTPITVPNMIFHSCQMICEDEAWDLNGELNNPLEASELLNGEESNNDLTDQPVMEAINAQYDEVSD